MALQIVGNKKFIQGYLITNEEIEKNNLDRHMPMYFNVDHIKILERIKKEPVIVYSVKMVTGELYQVWFDPPINF